MATDFSVSSSENSSSRQAAFAILPYFIGDGREATFHVNYFRPTSSPFPSNVELLSQFWSLTEFCATQRIIPVQTCQLDEVEECRPAISSKSTHKGVSSRS